MNAWSVRLWLLGEIFTNPKLVGEDVMWWGDPYQTGFSACHVHANVVTWLHDTFSIISTPTWKLVNMVNSCWNAGTAIIIMAHNRHSSWPSSHINLINFAVMQAFICNHVQPCKWGNEGGIRPHLCTCRLICGWRTSWGWWDELYE